MSERLRTVLGHLNASGNVQIVSFSLLINSHFPLHFKPTLYTHLLYKLVCFLLYPSLEHLHDDMSSRGLICLLILAEFGPFLYPVHFKKDELRMLHAQTIDTMFV